jgi:hypothetical protein
MKTKTILTATLVGALTFTTAQAQQYPNPTTVAEVPGPAAGNTMTKEYVQMVGRMAYFWGWPLVANFNRSVAFSKVPEPGLVGGVVPIAYGGIAMLTDYVTPDQRVIACANQDVVYGPGFLPLDKEPFVVQLPEFGERFWVFALYDARTDEFSELGKAYSTKPGFYLVVGPDWKAETPPRHHGGGAFFHVAGICRSARFHGRHGGGSQSHPARVKRDQRLSAVAVRREGEDQGLEQASALSRAEDREQRRD